MDKGDNESAAAVETLNELDGRRSRKDKDVKDTAKVKGVDTLVQGDATVQDVAKAEKESDKPQTNKDLIAKDQSATPVSKDELHSDSKEDRRGDRREKWFERDSVASNYEATEASRDGIADLTDRDLADKLNPSLARDSSVATPSLDKSIVAEPAPASPIATLPTPPTSTSAQVVAASTLQSNSTQVNSTPSSTSEGNRGTTHVSSNEPTRTVGNRLAKADAKPDAEQPQVSQQERVRVIQRIARSFNRISSEGGQINIRLHPEQLGSVSVQVRLEGRTLTAKLATETTAARDAIMQDLPALRQRLADQGFDVAKFQVDVAGNGADATFSQSNTNSQSGQSQSRSSGGIQTDYRRIAARREASVAYSRAASTQQVPIWSDRNSIDLQA